MRKLNFAHLKIILALLALLSCNTPSYETCLAAVLITMAVIVATSFFTLTVSLFPKKLLPLALILFVVAFYQSFSYFTPVPALYLASFFLLFDWNDVDRNRLGPKAPSLVFRLVLFLVGTFLLEMAHSYFSKRFGGAFFRQPVRILTLLSLWALVLQQVLPWHTKRQPA